MDLYVRHYREQSIGLQIAGADVSASLGLCLWTRKVSKTLRVTVLCVLDPFQGDFTCLKLVIFSEEEEFLGLPSYFIRHRKVWQLFKTQPETDLKSCTCLQGLAALPRAARICASEQPRRAAGIHPKGSCGC